MSEYIKREDAIKALCESLPHTCHIEDCGFGCREAAAILAVPAAIRLPDLPPALEDLFRRALDPEWQKAHQQMGFISPLAEAYEALGAYEEGPGKTGSAGGGVNDMGFCLSVTGPCRDCMDAEILVRRSRNWIGDSITVPTYKVWCKHENVCRKLQQPAASQQGRGGRVMASGIKRLNNWFYRHRWRRDVRGYEQYLWKEQDTCFIAQFDGKKYRQINETTVLIWPSAKTISITNRSFWRSDDGSEMDKPVGNGFGFSFTAEEFQKIKELYDALNNELQTARGNKS